MDNIAKIRSSDGEINESSHQTSVATHVDQRGTSSKGKFVIFFDGKSMWFGAQQTTFIDYFQGILTLTEKQTFRSSSNLDTQEIFLGSKILNTETVIQISLKLSASMSIISCEYYVININ